jgi:hypothetical protein
MSHERGLTLFTFRAALLNFSRSFSLIRVPISQPPFRPFTEVEYEVRSMGLPQMAVLS